MSDTQKAIKLQKILVRWQLIEQLSPQPAFYGMKAQDRHHLLLTAVISLLQRVPMLKFLSDRVRTGSRPG